MTQRKIVVGVTGASGAPYARRLLSVLLQQPDVEVGCVLSRTARSVWALECGGSPEDLGATVYPSDSYAAPFASGSAGWHAMVVVPCSMGTLSRIAHGTSESLLTRAADVMLKERRTLILVPRETPMSTIHLENMLTASRAGALVLPACPSFYGRPRSLLDVVDTVVARVLDQLGIAHELATRWGSHTATSETT